MTTPGYQLVLPSGLQTCPRASCNMKRATRVPASSTVRMNSASNIMAKWYQTAISAVPPNALEKMCAIPTANAGAPPVRLKSVVSPTAFASRAMSDELTAYPQLEMVSAALCGAMPTIALGLLMAKYVPGCNTQAAIMAITPTKDSQAMAPYPTKRTCDSLAMSLGVVPLEMSEWNPLMAPQAIVMNANGKIFPANAGPLPLEKMVSGGICNCGRTAMMPIASSAIVPSLTNVLR